jgi:hypothetical protein
MWLLPAAIAGVAAVIIWFAVHSSEPAVYVTVVNHGPATLRAVTVQVTGRAHVLGDLAPGQSKRRKVLPTDATAVAVEYTDDAGRRVRLDVGGAFKPGDRGEVVIELRDGKVAASRFNLTEGE